MTQEVVSFQLAGEPEHHLAARPGALEVGELPVQQRVEVEERQVRGLRGAVAAPQQLLPAVRAAAAPRGNRPDLGAGLEIASVLLHA